MRHIGSFNSSRSLFNIKLLVLAIGLMVIMAPAAAFAYIDPGTGSFLLQGILAVVVGAGVTIKLFWGKIRAFFGKTTNDEDDDVDE